MGKTLIGAKLWNLEAVVSVCYSGEERPLFYRHTEGGEQAALGDETKRLKAN